MNTLSLRLCLLLVASVLASGSGAFAQNASLSKPILPLGPEELLVYLPQGSEEWEVVRSTVQNSFSGWILADAVREYEGQAIPESDADAPPVRPVTKITLKDTGYFPSANAVFRNFSPGRIENGEKLMLEGCPAIAMTLGESEVLRVSVGQRFIVSIEAKHQAPGAARKWLKTVKLSKLRSVQATGDQVLTRPFTMYVFDELNPEKNRTYSLTWTTQEEARDGN